LNSSFSSIHASAFIVSSSVELKGTLLFQVFFNFCDWSSKQGKNPTFALSSEVGPGRSCAHGGLWSNLYRSRGSYRQTFSRRTPSFGQLSASEAICQSNFGRRRAGEEWFEFKNVPLERKKGQGKAKFLAEISEGE